MHESAFNPLPCSYKLHRIPRALQIIAMLLPCSCSEPRAMFLPCSCSEPRAMFLPCSCTEPRAPRAPRAESRREPKESVILLPSRDDTSNMNAYRVDHACLS
jgi:hypothetical protein